MLLAWLVPCAAFAAGIPAPVPIGPAFQANVFTSSSQDEPGVAMEDDGDFVVVWRSEGNQDGYGSGIFGRRFASSGAALAFEFQVNAYTLNNLLFPSVALDGDADFVVVWESRLQDGSAGGVFGRRFSSAGTALAAEFQVNTYTSAEQRLPRVAAAAGGGFVVVWSSEYQDGSTYGIFARRFASGGVALATEFQVNDYTEGYQARPAVAMGADGRFVVAWDAYGPSDGSYQAVFARRFSSSGGALGAQFRVNVYTSSAQVSPAIALEDDGDFVIAWGSGQQDGSTTGVFARRFASSGSGVGTEFQVNSYTTGSQSRPAVAVDAGGDFVVAWLSHEQDGSSYGVFARRFAAAGVGVGAELQVNTYTSGSQNRSAVGVDGDGDLVIAWQSATQDGSGYGVFVQRFSTPAILDLDANGSADPLTDGLLLLRSLFGFTGATLTSGAIGGGCNRCDAAAIEAYIDSSRDLAFQGGEFQANVYTLGSQINTVVGIEADGDFVVVWASAGNQDGSGPGVFGRRFEAGGSALGGEFQVNSYTFDSQWFPAVAMDQDGDFVVAWHSTGQDGSSNGVFARRFAATGAALGGEFQVNEHTNDSQAIPAAGMDADGDFVIAWQSNAQDGEELGVFARRFAASGTPIAVEFQVNTNTTADQGLPAVGMAPGGAFVVTWESNYQDGSANGVFARRFGAMGVGLGAEFRANVHTEGDQASPAVTIDGSGAFAIAWQSDFQDGSSDGVFARRFDGSGAAVGAEVQVNAYTQGDQEKPRIALDLGGFVVVWQSFLQDGFDRGVFARRVGPAGGGLGPELQVNSYVTSAQAAPTIGSTGAGAFVVAWNSMQDGAVYGPFARRLAAVDLFDIDGNGETAPLTDGLLVLRFLFGFTGTALTTGAVDVAGCTRCDAATIDAYLQTLR
jgi:hypothetical protein